MYKMLEEIRKSIDERKVAEAVESTEDSGSSQFDIEKWVVSQLIESRKKFKPKQNRRHRDADK